MTAAETMIHGVEKPCIACAREEPTVVLPMPSFRKTSITVRTSQWPTVRLTFFLMVFKPALHGSSHTFVQGLHPRAAFDHVKVAPKPTQNFLIWQSDFGLHDQPDGAPAIMPILCLEIGFETVKVNRCRSLLPCQSR